METNLLLHEVDMLISDISARQIVPTAEVIDRLLDIRTQLVSSETAVTGA